MSGLLKTGVLLSLSGTIVALLIFLLLKIGRNKLPKTGQYYIWLIVLVRFVVPLPLEILIPIEVLQEVSYDTQNNTAVIEEQKYNTQTQYTKTEQSIEQISYESAVSEPETAVTAEKDNAAESSVPRKSSIEVLLDCAAIGWILITAVLFVKGMAEYRGFMKQLKMSCVKVESKKILEAYEQAGKRLKIRKLPPLYTSNLIYSPMQVGFFRPCIIVPELQIEENSYLKYVFCHELTHYRRMDCFYKQFVQFIVCLHFFNPVVYFIRRQINKLCELSCDERVTAQLNEKGIQEYGDILIDSLLLGKNTVITPNTNMLCERAEFIKERLDSIINFQKNSKKKRVFLGICALFVGLGAAVCPNATFAQYHKQDTIQKTEGQQIAEEKLRDEGKDSTYIETKDVNDTYKNKVGKFYTQNRYYANDYIMEIGWNIDSSKYPQTVILNTGKKSYTVSFTESTKQYSSNDKLLEAVRQFLLEESEKDSKRYGNFKPETPVVTEIVGPFSANADQLTAKFYQEENIEYYAPVIQKASPAVREEYANKAYSENKKEYFLLLSYDMTDEQKEKYAEKAYKDNREEYFKSLAYEMTAEQRSKYAEKAYNDNRQEYFQSLSYEMTEKQRAEYAEKVYNDNREEYFQSLSYEMTEEQRAKYAEKAYNDNREEYFQSLSYEMTEEQRAKYAEKAYNDNREEYFKSLAYEMTAQQKEKYIEKAYNDNKPEYFEPFVYEMTEEQIGKYAEKAYNDNRLEYFEPFIYEMTKEQIGSIAEKAYDDNKENFFASLIYEMTTEQVDKYAIKAYEDGKENILQQLSYEISSKTRENLILRAKKDGNEKYKNLLEW